MIQPEPDKTPDPPAIPPAVYHICRILLGIIFVAASIDKILRPWDFGIAILFYKFLVGPFSYLISPMAIIMPIAELVAGLMLIFNKWVRPAALLILAMNVVFVIAILSAMIRGIDVECGCGFDVGVLGVIAGTHADIQALVRDFVFIAMTLVVLFAPQSKNHSN